MRNGFNFNVVEQLQMEKPWLNRNINWNLFIKKKQQNGSFDNSLKESLNRINRSQSLARTRKVSKIDKDKLCRLYQRYQVKMKRQERAKLYGNGLCERSRNNKFYQTGRSYTINSINSPKKENRDTNRPRKKHKNVKKYFSKLQRRHRQLYPMEIFTGKDENNFKSKLQLMKEKNLYYKLDPYC